MSLNVRWVKITAVALAILGSMLAFQNCAKPMATSDLNQSSLSLAISPPVEFSPFGKTAISRYHSCFITDQRTAKCWGENSSGQLGNGDTTRATVPVTVSNLTNVIQISAASSFSCAVLVNGELKCWGYGSYGQLGDGNGSGMATTPVTALLSNVRQVSTGRNSFVTCAVLQNGEAHCFGNLSQLNLKNLPMTSKTPVLISSITSAAQIEIDDYHACVLQNDGQVQCWGNNNVGQAGIGTTGNVIDTPTLVHDLSSVKQISLGLGHTCALLSSGQVKCWGMGGQGQLGQGVSMDSSLPVLVPNLENVVQLVSGNYHTCALQSGGQVKCWGDNAFSLKYELTPIDIPGYADAKAISAASERLCAIHKSGEVNCWN